MRRFLQINPEWIFVLATLAVLCLLALMGSRKTFSPGPLNAKKVSHTSLGGVRSHAEIEERCDACHAPPWSATTMNELCQECHTDVRQQIENHQPMHGRFSQIQPCRACHPEHNGPDGLLTRMERFNHDLAAFALTGKHKDAACERCHANNVFRGTPQECVACHEDPPIHRGRFGTQCARCHSTATWAFQLGEFDHNMAAFPLTGKHKDVLCKRCHANDVFRGTPQTCVACHPDPPIHKGRLGTQCARCHSTDTWKYQPGEFDHNLPAFKLTGKHQATKCEACHLNGVYRGTPLACVACHADPPVHRGKFGTDCARCHSTSTWKASLDRFDHNLAAFKLTGKHQATKCEACHRNGVYRGTPQTCVGCHADPPVHRGKFGTDCARCHSTSTWKANLDRFDHNMAAFKLTGKHRTTRCDACHAKGVYRGTPQACAACHADPPVHRGKFGTACAQCHTTDTWKPRFDNKHFDHNRTAFKLTGKHATTVCAACHAKNVFHGTPTSCVACHAEPQQHRGKFGTACAQCHSTVTWKGATFKHPYFPMNHGQRGRGNSSCTTCHPNQNNYRAYTCYGCHEHDPARVAKQHREIRAPNLQDCIHCHAGGGKGREHGGGGRGGGRGGGGRGRGRD